MLMPLVEEGKEDPATQREEHRHKGAHSITISPRERIVQEKTQHKIFPDVNKLAQILATRGLRRNGRGQDRLRRKIKDHSRRGKERRPIQKELHLLIAHARSLDLAVTRFPFTAKADRKGKRNQL